MEMKLYRDEAEEKHEQPLAPPDSRKFQVYNVGLAKTGTTSMSQIFHNYQTAHEFLLPETGQQIKDFQAQKTSEEEFREFLHTRDTVANLEMDSTFCHGHYVDLLAEEFPSAQFIFTIRDCYSWLDSVINMIATHRKITHLDLIFGVSDALIGDPEALREHFPDYLDTLLSLWQQMNQEILEELPADRSLIVRTQDISSRIDDIARFVDVPEETLDTTKSHEFKAVQKLNILRSMEAGELEEHFRWYCADIMREFFPGYSFQQFLQGEPVSSPITTPIPGLPNDQSSQ